MAKSNKLAGIEYAGIAGASHECQDAVLRLLQFGDEITRARILSFSNRHCLLLTVNAGDPVAVKSGFSSGYGGEGPRRFSYVLQLLIAYKVEIEEYPVQETLIERLDKSALTLSDIEDIDSARPVRPSRWYDYVLDEDFYDIPDARVWSEFRPVIPLAIIDIRIIDLAISFWKNPDERLLTGYRRLEDAVRERTGLDKHGMKLFSQAFGEPTPSLHWKDIDDGERAGRVNLFTGAYMAHRNPRAHRELKSSVTRQLTEFLLLNHLFLLEKDSHIIC